VLRGTTSVSLLRARAIEEPAAGYMVMPCQLTGSLKSHAYSKLTVMMAILNIKVFNGCMHIPSVVIY
jgi:hypothetical protein